MTAVIVADSSVTPQPNTSAYTQTSIFYLYGPIITCPIYNFCLLFLIFKGLGLDRPSLWGVIMSLIISLGGVLLSWEPSVLFGEDIGDPDLAVRIADLTAGENTRVRLSSLFSPLNFSGWRFLSFAFSLTFSLTLPLLPLPLPLTLPLTLSAMSSLASFSRFPLIFSSNFSSTISSFVAAGVSSHSLHLQAGLTVFWSSHNKCRRNWSADLNRCFEGCPIQKHITTATHCFSSKEYRSYHICICRFYRVFDVQTSCTVVARLSVWFYLPTFVLIVERADAISEKWLGLPPALILRFSANAVPRIFIQ